MFVPCQWSCPWWHSRLPGCPSPSAAAAATVVFDAAPPSGLAPRRKNPGGGGGDVSLEKFSVALVTGRKYSRNRSRVCKKTLRSLRGALGAGLTQSATLRCLLRKLLAEPGPAAPGKSNDAARAGGRRAFLRRCAGRTAVKTMAAGRRSATPSGLARRRGWSPRNRPCAPPRQFMSRDDTNRLLCTPWWNTLDNLNGGAVLSRAPRVCAGPGRNARRGRRRQGALHGAAPGGAVRHTLTRASNARQRRALPETAPSRTGATATTRREHRNQVI